MALIESFFHRRTPLVMKATKEPELRSPLSNYVTSGMNTSTTMTLCWKAVYKVSAAVTALGIIPYSKLDLFEVLGSWILALPIVGTVLKQRP
jgi:hypothetical protein